MRKLQQARCYFSDISSRALMSFLRHGEASRIPRLSFGCTSPLYRRLMALGEWVENKHLIKLRVKQALALDFLAWILNFKSLSCYHLQKRLDGQNENKSNKDFFLPKWMAWHLATLNSRSQASTDQPSRSRLFCKKVWSSHYYPNFHFRAINPNSGSVWLHH
jgi:hypothetical protein